MFKRAFARAELPLRHSEGFNPHPRISVVLPRPVGVASKDELLIVELERPTTAQSALQQLADQLPTGVQLLDVSDLHDRDRRVPIAATYQLPVAEDEISAANAAITSLEASKTWPVERASAKRGTRTVDIRAFIIDIGLNDGVAFWRQSISQDGTARVGEVLDAIQLSQQSHLHLVVRTRVEYAS